MYVKKFSRAFCGLLLLFVAVSFAIGASPAFAHANLVRSQPTASEVLDGPPSEVKLWFSEVPDPNFSSVQLVDKLGNQIGGVGSLKVDTADNTLLSASLPAVAPGVYTVIWRATSAVDGHVTNGAFAFVVGRDQVPAGGLQPVISGSEAPGSGPTLPGVVVRWLTYLTMALLTGGFAFVPLVFQPALGTLTRSAGSIKSAQPIPEGSFSHDSGLFALLAINWLLLLIVTLAGAYLQAGLVSGGDPLAAGGLLTLLTASRYGSIFWMRGGLLLLLGGMLAFRQSPWWSRSYAAGWWLGGLVFSGLLLVTISLESHAAALSQALIPALADWLHLLSSSIWLGGLAALLLTLLWLRRTRGGVPGRTVAALVSRYSLLAAVSLALVLATGLIQAFFEVVQPTNLIDTDYGEVLLFKMAVLIPLLALGGFNFLFVVRRIKATLDAPDTDAAMQPWYRLIKRTVGAEIVFIGLILLVTSVLTALPPAREAFSSGMVVRAAQDDLVFIVAMNPGQPGLNTYDIYVKDDLNRPVNDAERVSLIFSMVEMDMGQTEAVAEKVGDGHYVVQGGYISMIGTWHTEVLVRRAGLVDVRKTLTFPLITATPLSNTFVLVAPSRLLLGLEIIAAGILLFFGARRLGRARRWTLWPAGIVGVVLFGLGTSVASSGFASGANAVAILQNPVAADSASLQRGQVIYRANCVTCHGDSGAGDGSLAANLKPPPANLQIHMAAGHTDGQLFDWLTNGIVGSAMPAFGTRLSDQQRWDVINYIRTFAKS